MIGQALLWGGIALAASPVVAWLFLVWWRHPAVAYAFGIAITLFSFTLYGHPLFRLAIVLPLIPHLAFALIARRQPGNDNLPSPAVPIIYIAACALSLLWSIQPTETISGIAAWVVVLVFVLTFRRLLTVKQIITTSFALFASFTAISILTLALPASWEAGRARGLFENANSLGLACLFTLGLAIWLGRRFWAPLSPPLMGVLALTGSRASFFAAFILITLAILPHLRPAYRWMIAVVSTMAAYPTFQWINGQLVEVDANNTSVFRTTNSRDAVWAEITGIIQDNRWLGVGYDAGPSVIANSYLKLFGEFGILTSAAGLALVLGYLFWSRHDRVILAFSIAACANALFEDWLLTAGSPFLLTFLMLTMSTRHSAKEEPTQVTPSTANQAADLRPTPIAQ